MPNWVYNSLTIYGKSEELQAFLTKATEPRPYEDGLSEIREFSFWNFIAPPEDKLDEYFSINGYVDGESKGNTEYNWYNWNNENWGTKWDANDQFISEVEDSKSRGTLKVKISYNTAWGIPDPVMRVMVEQHRELSFYFYCEEEQGWGSKFVGENGDLEEVESWDIPNSHADYVARDNEDGCLCSYSDDEEDWYDDCLKPNKDSNQVVAIDEMETCK